MSDDEYITSEEAAELLQVVVRQVYRYSDGPNARLRSRPAGRRKMIHRGDVEQLARDLGVANKPRKKPPSVELAPAMSGEFLRALQQKDDEIRQLRNEITQMAHQMGQLQGEVAASRKLFEDQQHVRQRLEAIEDERAELLRGQSSKENQPWWKRLFGG